MTESQFSDAVRKLTREDLVEFGSGHPRYGDGTPFDPVVFQSRNLGLWSGRGQLVASGPGQYLVYLGGLGFVVDQDGRPYELNLRAKIEAGR